MNSSRKIFMVKKGSKIKIFCNATNIGNNTQRQKKVIKKQQEKNTNLIIFAH